MERLLVPSCLKSSVKLPQPVMILVAMVSSGVGLLCFVYAAVYGHFRGIAASTCLIALW